MSSCKPPQNGSSVPPNIFRANDIRGVFGRDFNLNFASGLAAALILALKERGAGPAPKILAGRDARLAGPALKDALIKALVAEGAEVADAGLAPSPLCWFSLRQEDMDAAISVTASHNPASHNGFKIMFSEKLNCPEPIAVLKKLFFSLQNRRPAGKKPQARRGFVFDRDCSAAYIKSLKNEFPSLPPVPLCIDCGNGAAGPLAKQVFSALDLKPRFLFCEPDGRFPNHHPDPTEESNLKDLKRETAASCSLFGAGFDGDGDRIGVVSPSGRFVLGDELAFVFARSLLSKNLSKNAEEVQAGGERGAGLAERKSAGNGGDPAPPGPGSGAKQGRAEKSKRIGRRTRIAADVKCSDWLFEAIRDGGGEPIMSKSGHSFARRALEREKAALAVEFSGHIFFNDRPGRGFDDGIYNALRLAELLGRSSSLESRLPPLNPFRTGEIRRKMSRRKRRLAEGKLKLYLKKRGLPFIEKDGVRFSGKTSWGLFRPSQTQSDMTSLRLEASSKKEFLSLKKDLSRITGCAIP